MELQPEKLVETADFVLPNQKVLYRNKVRDEIPCLPDVLVNLVIDYLVRIVLQ